MKLTVDVMIAAAMTRKTITRAASPSPDSPLGPGSWTSFLSEPSRWRIIVSDIVAE